MNIVITMAGHGQRFFDEGYDVPKPLIDVDGEPMYARVTRMLPLDHATRLVFVCLAEHLERYGLADDIERRFHGHEPRIVALDHVTAGQACTAWEARRELAFDQHLVIHNADTLVASDLPGTLRRHPGAAGVLSVFEAEGDHWSFARLDGAGRVVETAEKVRISPWASTGLYHFRDPATFGRIVESATLARAASGEAREVYVAPLYNELIARGLEVVVDVASRVVPLGTPAELDRHRRSTAAGLTCP